MSDISHKLAFNAFTEVRREFKISIVAKNSIQRLLQKIGIVPRYRILQVSPIKYGVRGICATYLNKATFDQYAQNSLSKAASLFSEYELENVVMFLACVLWNRQDNPPKWLIDGIKDKDQEGIDEIVEFAKSSIDTQAFLNSIISMTGVSLQPEEIIAPENDAQEHIR